MLRRNKPTKRIVPSQMVSRASRTETGQLLSWLDTSVISLGSAADNWRYHNGSKEDVDMCIDALYTIWNELQTRGT